MENKKEQAKGEFIFWYYKGMDGTYIATAQEKQGGIMAHSNALTNVRVFRKTEAISALDRFLLRNGAKQMVTPKKDEASPIEWNKSVLGLTATLIAILGVLVGFVWNYAVLSTKFELQQQEMNQIKTEVKDLKSDITRFKEFQLKTDAYKLGMAEGNKEDKK